MSEVNRLQILLGRLNEGRLNLSGLCHIWEKIGIHIVNFALKARGKETT